jgi:predicted component of type VI protein secretion system
MPAQLLALTDGPTIVLEKPIMLMGRHEECDVQLNSRKVSRKHCCVAHVDDHLVIRDLGSTNGVRINGQRVLEGQLKTGDELTVGNFRYQVFFDNAKGKPIEVHVPVERPAMKPGKTIDSKAIEEADEPIPIDESNAPSQVLDALPVVKKRPQIESAFVLPDKLRNPESRR